MSEPTHIGDMIAGLHDQLAAADTRADWAPERLGVTREPLDEHLRKCVLMRDRYTCRWCGRDARSGALLEVDHIVPWSAGGADHPVNLRTLCQDCNQQRSNRRTDMTAARALPIVIACQRCAFNDASNDLAIAAYCLTCHKVGTSPYELVGGPIPLTGVPSAGVVTRAS